MLGDALPPELRTQPSGMRYPHGPRLSRALAAREAGSCLVPRCEEGVKGLSPFSHCFVFNCPNLTPSLCSSGSSTCGPARGCTFTPLAVTSVPRAPQHRAGPCRVCHGPQRDRRSLSACHRCSSHQLLACVLGKHLSTWRKGLCGEIFSLFPFFAGHR